MEGLLADWEQLLVNQANQCFSITGVPSITIPLADVYGPLYHLTC
jgi:hypothetical protein